MPSDSIRYDPIKKRMVSVIIPVYKVSAYIERCLNSVLHQTYTDLECIIVDDATPDDSIEKCEKLISAYQGPMQFVILHHETNRGLSAARNTGTAAATGEFLYYLDSDDEITSDCIEQLMDCVAAHPDVQMVQGRACRHYLEGGEVFSPKVVREAYVASHEKVRECYYKTSEIYVNVWNKLLRRDFIVENGILCQEGLLYEDNLWVFYLLKYLNCAAFCPEVTYHQWKRPHSITSGTAEKVTIESYAKIFSEILENLTPGFEQEEFDYYGRVVADMYVRIARIVPEFYNVLRLYLEKCSQYGSRSLYLRMVLSRLLGPFKYGHAIWNGIIRLKNLVLYIPRKMSIIDRH